MKPNECVPWNLSNFRGDREAFETTMGYGVRPNSKIVFVPELNVYVYVFDTDALYKSFLNSDLLYVAFWWKSAGPPGEYGDKADDYWSYVTKNGYEAKPGARQKVLYIIAATERMIENETATSTDSQEQHQHPAGGFPDTCEG